MKIVKRILYVSGVVLLLTSSVSASSYSYMYKQCMTRFDGKQCTELGLYTIKMRGENLKGFEYIQRACKVDDARGCRIVGDVFMDGEIACKDPFLAKKYYDKACKLGSTIACRKYEKYRPYVVHEQRSLSGVIGNLFGRKPQTRESYAKKAGCKCKISTAPKVNCPEHKDPN